MKALPGMNRALLSPSWESRPPNHLARMRAMLIAWGMRETSEHPHFVFHCRPGPYSEWALPRLKLVPVKHDKYANEPAPPRDFSCLFRTLYRLHPNAEHYWLAWSEDEDSEPPEETGMRWERSRGKKAFLRLIRATPEGVEGERVPFTPTWMPKAFVKVKDLRHVPVTTLRKIRFPLNETNDRAGMGEFMWPDETGLNGEQVLERCPFEDHRDPRFDLSFQAEIGGLELAYCPRKHLRWWVGDGSFGPKRVALWIDEEAGIPLLRTSSTGKKYQVHETRYGPPMGCKEPFKSKILRFLGLTLAERRNSQDMEVMSEPAHFPEDEYWLDLAEEEAMLDLPRPSSAQYDFYPSGFWTRKPACTSHGGFTWVWDDSTRSWVERWSCDLPHYEEVFESSGQSRPYRWGTPGVREKPEHVDTDPSFEEQRNPLRGGYGMWKPDDFAERRPRRIRENSPYTYPKGEKATLTFLRRLFSHLERLDTMALMQAKREAVWENNPHLSSADDHTFEEWLDHGETLTDHETSCLVIARDLEDHLWPFMEREYLADPRRPEGPALAWRAAVEASLQAALDAGARRDLITAPEAAPPTEDLPRPAALITERFSRIDPGRQRVGARGERVRSRVEVLEAIEDSLEYARTQRPKRKARRHPKPACLRTPHSTPILADIMDDPGQDQEQEETQPKEWQDFLDDCDAVLGDVRWQIKMCS